MSSPNDFARLVSQGRRKDEQLAKLERERDDALAYARDARADERERCAKEIERIATGSRAATYRKCAEAIRALEDK